MRTTIFRKGLLLIAVPVLSQAVFVALLMRVMADAAYAERWALHSKDVIGRAEGAYGQLASMQAAARAFVATRNEVFAADLEAAVAAARRQLDSLHALVVDNPAQQARVVEVRRWADALVDWNIEQSQLVRSGRRDEAIDRTGRLEGRERITAVRRALDGFLSEEERIGRQRTDNLERARSAQRWAVGLGTLGLAAAAVFAAAMFGRGVAGRLAVVTRNAERLGRNEPLAAPVGGRDEIARLDAVVHATADRLAAADRAEAGLRAELRRRAEELARSNESLRQQTQENEMFVYSVSHDLRSPLVNLQGFSRELGHATREITAVLADGRIPDDLRARARGVMDEDVADSVRFIQTAVSRSSAIIDALLRLSRAGRVEYRPQAVDVRAVVQRVVDAMRSTIVGRGAEVVVGDLAPTWGDPTAVEQMFGNLVGNAVNYLAPDRPGRVEVGMRDDGRPDDRGLRTYYVRDNGLGIPAAYLGKVFVAFQRLHGEVATGEGIGLALVRRAVERHGGRAWVESVEGAGATFYLALPAEEPKAGAVAGSEAAAIDPFSPVPGGDG